MKTNQNPDSSLLMMKVLQQFRLIYGSMRQHFRLVERRCGMSGSQTWVLQEIQNSPGMGINELAVRMGIHQSTASLLVDKLAMRDCLTKERSRGDQRRVGLRIAPKGIVALAALPGPAEGVLPEALSEIPLVALKTLHVNLDELIAHLSGKDQSYAEMTLADMDEQVEREIR